MKKLSAILWIVFSLMNKGLFAGDSYFKEDFGIGISGGLNFNSHSADFSKLPGFENCCPVYENGSGSGMNLGLILEYPLSDIFALQIRPAYSSLSGDLTDEESKVINLSGEAETGIFEHKLEAGFPVFDLGLFIDINFIDELSFLLGWKFGFPLSPEFTQTESLKEPAGYGAFIDSDRQRNTYNEKIPNTASVISSLCFGLKYEFPLNNQGNLVLSPEVNYAIGLNNIAEGLLRREGEGEDAVFIDDGTWKVSTFSAGLSLVYRFGEEVFVEEPVPEIPAVDTTEEVIAVVEEIIPEPDTVAVIEPEPEPIHYELNTRIAARAVVDNKVEELDEIQVEEFLSTRMQPILNYVFFDHNSYTIPERYKQISTEETAGFNVNSLFAKSTLETYYDILNIYGMRLQANPEETITITGCNSKRGAEKGNAYLSRRRANMVANYLQDVWGIDKSRIKVKARHLPKTPSNWTDKDGIEENRRVELSSDSWIINSPIILRDTLLRVSVPAVRFFPEVHSDAGIENWELIISQNGRVLKRMDGTGDIPKELDWVLSRDDNSIPRENAPVEYKLTVLDKQGQVNEESYGELAVNLNTIWRKKNENVSDYKFDKFSLILFDFDTFTLNEENMKIAEIINKETNKQSELTITGYTDRVGDSEHNLDLSQKRAAEIERLLSPENKSSHGVGETQLLYNNELPEGRFYSRTVEIEAKTPIDWKTTK